MTWIIFVLAIVGVVLNIRKHWSCFAVWLVTNGFWAVHNLLIGQYAQAVLFGVYFGLSVYGLLTWKGQAELDKVKDELIKQMRITIKGYGLKEKQRLRRQGQLNDDTNMTEKELGELKRQVEEHYEAMCKYTSLKPVKNTTKPYGGRF